ncbi:MAG: hypothetical protein M1134_05405 [Actinobacteria bacterium]|nr:hypothetical protein [Actinomycetota bacterium]
MAKANDIDEGPLGRLQPDRPAGADLQLFTAEVERPGFKLVNAARCPKDWASASSGDRDVDGGGNGVDQFMASESGLQTQRGMWDTLGDLDQVRVGGRRVGPAVDAASKREDLPAVAQGVKAPVTNAGLLGLAVGERIAQVLSER